jgi:cephalosporin hydroxylase
MKNKRLSEVIDRIQNEPLEKLSDPAYLEYRLLPELGLNDRHMHQYPTHLHPYCGIGIDSWQYPNQFSKYLCYLSQCEIRNYVEIGCHKGGTFIITCEYLSRFHKLENCVAVDNWPREIMHDYAEHRTNVSYLTNSSCDESFIKLVSSKAWDLILIDGDHSYSGVLHDYNAVGPFAKMIAFHDIKNIFCPGTQQIWQDLQKQYPKEKLHEWTDQYDDVLLRVRGSVMGIGLVDNR